MDKLKILLNMEIANFVILSSNQENNCLKFDVIDKALFKFCEIVENVHNVINTILP